MDVQTNRRIETKRIPLDKKVELLSTDGSYISGQTDNVSDYGMRARFDALPEMGPDVRLRVFFAEGEDPIEHEAAVVWRQSGPDGAHETLGFKLKPNTEEIAETVREAPKMPRLRLAKQRIQFALKENTTEEEATPPVIERGAPVWLQKGDVSIQAEVVSISEISADNQVNISLKITDSAFADSSALAASDTGELQDFTNHPFRDAWQITRKYAGPVIILLSKLSIQAAKWSRTQISVLWQKYQARKS